MAKEPIKGLYFMYAVAQRCQMNLVGMYFPMSVQNLWKDRYKGDDREGYIIFDNEVIHRNKEGSYKAFRIVDSWIRRNMQEDKKNILVLYVPADTNLNDLADIIRAAQTYGIRIGINVWNRDLKIWIQHPFL